MFLQYQLTMYSSGRMIDCIHFKGYDDFSAIHKAERFFKIGSFDSIRLTRDGKNIKVLRKK